MALCWKKASDAHWRHGIYHKLRDRNKKEYENINELIQLHNRLFEQSELLRTENLQLTLQNEKLRQENSDLHSKGAGGDGGSGTGSAAAGASSQVVQALEQKLYKLQEELTDLHRRKGENAQQLVELNQCLQERDKLLATKEN
ncbi:autophagy-related protein 16-like, partial [Penaeus indicus]|uniref:autophagy-related protein 16-like n=1 Tax=Penaeus indicus TaxID=29960 RepID=UPI00300C7516